MLHRWQHGRTGFPLIDAAMRQLWKVGWMPNYLRHVTAQFLIEYLDVSWKQGLQWFDYTLVDSDVAINAMMWPFWSWGLEFRDASSICSQES